MSKNVKQLDFSYTADMNVKEYNHLEKTVWYFLINLNIQIPKIFNSIWANLNLLLLYINIGYEEISWKMISSYNEEVTIISEWLNTLRISFSDKNDRTDICLENYFMCFYIFLYVYFCQRLMRFILFIVIDKSTSTPTCMTDSFMIFAKLLNSWPRFCCCVK